MILQRELVGRRIRLSDAELVTKYTFPFVRTDWTVAFAITDVLGLGPRVLQVPLRRDPHGLASELAIADLRMVDTIPIEDFNSLVHFDPWWDFRGVVGVRREWIQAVFASNIAKAFTFRGRFHKIRDLEFSDSLQSLDVTIAQDDRYHRVPFRRGDVDLLSLRSSPRRLLA